MSNKKNCSGEGITRREFLIGASEGMALFAVPSFLQGLLSQSAQAAGAPSWTSRCALLHVHASGGWGFQGTFVAKTAAGGPIASSILNSHGLDSTALARLFTGCGAEMYLDSGFTQGFRSAVTASSEARVKIATILNTSGDDNTTGAKYGLIPAATLAGVEALVSNSAGLENSVSGNNTFSTVSNPGAQRLYARTVGDIINSAAFSRVLGSANPRLLTAISDGVRRVSQAQFDTRLGNDPGEQLFRSVQGENFERLSSKITPPAGATPEEMNPANPVSPTLSLFGLTAKDAPTIQTSTNATELQAALIYNALLGNFGPVALRLGGYDYHGRADTDTFQRDRELGQLVGRAAELAVRMNKTLLVFVTTDGGVSANPDFPFSAAPGTSDDNRWQGDRRAYCGAALIVVNGPSLKRNFLGHVRGTNGQVEESTPVGLDFMATAAVIANWLFLNDRMAELDRVLTAAGLSVSQIEAVRTQILF